MDQQNHHQAAPQPVVPSVQIPKINLPQGHLGVFNALSVTFASFFGVCAIFGAIAQFTANASTPWQFSIPVIGNIPILSSLLFPTGISALLITSLLALLLGVIGFITTRKITDASVITKPYSTVSAIFSVLGVIFAAVAIATAFFGLYALGEKSGVKQSPIWLNTFLPYLIFAGTSFGIATLSNKIAKGNTAILGLFSTIALGVAGLGFILVTISTLVNFYGKKSSSSYDIEDMFDYFKK